MSTKITQFIKILFYFLTRGKLFTSYPSWENEKRVWDSRKTGFPTKLPWRPTSAVGLSSSNASAAPGVPLHPTTDAHPGATRVRTYSYLSLSYNPIIKRLVWITSCIICMLLSKYNFLFTHTYLRHITLLSSWIVASTFFDKYFCNFIVGNILNKYLHTVFSIINIFSCHTCINLFNIQTRNL